MNLLTKRWTISKIKDRPLVEELSQALNINLVLANLLVHRGITGFEEAKKFFRPSLNDLHDPFLMRDMPQAIERIEKAIAQRERILVYGDYDVDGTTAVSLAYSFFNKIYGNIDYYIPDRYKEGYGISTTGIDYAKETNCTLIIALDCGIKAIEKVDYANSLGIDFIICDHHLPGEKIPAAAAVLDPKRSDCEYPFKELSGCGIGFKLIQAYAEKNNMPFDELLPYLDLVAVSTAADIVPIVGENRTLVKFGLDWLNQNARPGIRAILEIANVKKALTVSDIVFTIGPRINAAGRLHDARQAVKLLIAANKLEAMPGSKELNEHNDTRRGLDLQITEEALEMIKQNPKFLKRKSTVLFKEDWHKGVIGIVASRLTDKYYRPTIILTKSNGMATGSARSVKDFDIHNAIESCSDLLDQFGGHKYAAGLTMKLENIDAFVDRFEEVVSSTIEERMLTQEVEIDGVLRLDEITDNFFNVIKQFAPFGPGNLNPVFMAEGVRDSGWSKVIGKTNDHLKLNIVQSENARFGFDGIAFGMAPLYPMIERKMPFDVAFSIEENSFNGNTYKQLMVKDIRLK